MAGREAMLGALALLALLLSPCSAAEKAGGKSKAWKQWYWSEFKPEAGVGCAPPAAAAPPAPLPLPPESHVVPLPRCRSGPHHHRQGRRLLDIPEPLVRAALQQPAGAGTAVGLCYHGVALHPPATLRPPPPRRFHVQRFFAVLEEKDISKYDPSNDTIGADIPFSQNILVGAAALLLGLGGAFVAAARKAAWAGSCMQQLLGGALPHSACLSSTQPAEGRRRTRAAAAAAGVQAAADRRGAALPQHPGGAWSLMFIEYHWGEEPS